MRTWIVVIVALFVVAALWFLADGREVAGPDGIADPAARVATAEIPRADRDFEPVPSAASARSSLTTSTEAAQAKGAAPLRIHVRTPSGSPIAGAAIHARAGGTIARLGTTDSEGWLAAGAASGSRRTLVATHPGFAPASAPVSHPEPASIVLVLEPEARITGRVVGFDGAAAGAGLHVAALPSHLALGLHGASAERILADPEVRLVETDEAGAFEVAGLDARLRYTLLAGGRSMVQDLPRHRVRPGSAGVVLQVFQAHALHVEMVEPDGTPVRASEAYAGAGGVRTTLAMAKGKQASGYPLTHALTGIPTELEQLPANARLYVLLAPTNEESVGPLLLEASLPGYERANLSVLVRRLVEGVQRERWILQPTTKVFGSLVVEFHGGSSSRDDAARFGPRGILKLAVDDHRFLKYELAGSGPGPIRIDQIPAGTYRVSYEGLPDHTLLSPSGEDRIEIGARPAQVRFDLAGKGGFVLDVSAPDGRPYLGEFTFTLNLGELEKQADGGVVWHGGRVSFLHAPYVLAGIEPGVYAVLPEDPLPNEREWTRFEVVPGAVVRVAVELR